MPSPTKFQVLISALWVELLEAPMGLSFVTIERGIKIDGGGNASHVFPIAAEVTTIVDLVYPGREGIHYVPTAPLLNLAPEVCLATRKE